MHSNVQNCSPRLRKMYFCTRTNHNWNFDFGKSSMVGWKKLEKNLIFSSIQIEVLMKVILLNHQWFVKELGRNWKNTQETTSSRYFQTTSFETTKPKGYIRFRNVKFKVGKRQRCQNNANDIPHNVLLKTSRAHLRYLDCHCWGNKAKSCLDVDKGLLHDFSSPTQMTRTKYNPNEPCVGAFQKLDDHRLLQHNCPESIQ